MPLWYTTGLEGAESRIRTGDPFLFREMLYQLSYLGKNTLPRAIKPVKASRGIVAYLLADFTPAIRSTGTSARPRS